MRIQNLIIEKMIDHVLKEDPLEGCGILAGSDEIVSHLYRITNTARSPNRYLMDPQQQLHAMMDADRNGWDILAFYHSHTHGPAYPSQTDVRMALQSGWLTVRYVLISLLDKVSPQTKVFHIEENGNISEEELLVT